MRTMLGYWSLLSHKKENDLRMHCEDAGRRTPDDSIQSMNFNKFNEFNERMKESSRK